MMYRVSMSNKESVAIDEEQYAKLISNVDKNFVLLGNEMVNPSFIVSVTKINDWAFGGSSSYIEKPKKKITGHIDEERGVYVIDSEVEVVEEKIENLLS